MSPDDREKDSPKETVTSPKNPASRTKTISQKDNQQAVPVTWGGGKKSPGKKASEKTTVLPRREERGDGHVELVTEEKDRYTTRDSLGEGAMGDVELGYDQDIRREVAIKRLKDDKHSPDSIVRFTREIQTVGRLEHPNIVPIHDVGLDKKGRYYFVMKYVQGETLEEVLDQIRAANIDYLRKYTFSYRTQIFYDILRALDYAHSAGIIHRDLKPANIMIGRRGEVMVMDWGVSKEWKKDREGKGETGEGESEDDAFQTGNDVLVGTPAYMSPEQARGYNDELDPRSDIYSLSALFYEFLTTQYYLEGRTNVVDVLQSVIKEDPQPPFMVRPPFQTTVPIELNHFVIKGLNKDPDQRFQSVREMMDALDDIREGKIPIQCPTTCIKRASFSIVHLIDDHPFLAVGVVLLFLATFIYNVVAYGMGLLG